jgi:hypothetical protein
MFPNSVPLVMQEARYNSGSEKVNMAESGLSIIQQKKDWAFGLNPVFGGLNCDILIMFVGLNLERNLSQFWERCKGISYGPAALPGQDLCIFDV